MKYLLILGGAFGLSLSAAQACDFHKTAHADKNMSVASTDMDKAAPLPDRATTTASIDKTETESPVEASDDLQ